MIETGNWLRNNIQMIWHFMMKYTFYSMAIQKFEKEQQSQMEESLYLKDYYAKKLEIKEEVSEEQLIKHLNSQRLH